jgi:ubiquinone biosynthesis protein UbiJ
MGPDALVLALKSTFDPANADGLSATYELVLDGLPYAIRVADGNFEAARGEAGHPDATIRTDPMTLAGVVFRDRSLAAAVRSREVELEGDERAAERFVRMLAGR